MRLLSVRLVLLRTMTVVLVLAFLWMGERLLPFSFTKNDYSRRAFRRRWGGRRSPRSIRMDVLSSLTKLVGFHPTPSFPRLNPRVTQGFGRGGTMSPLEPATLVVCSSSRLSKFSLPEGRGLNGGCGDPFDFCPVLSSDLCLQNKMAPNAERDNPKRDVHLHTWRQKKRGVVVLYSAGSGQTREGVYYRIGFSTLPPAAGHLSVGRLSPRTCFCKELLPLALFSLGPV